MVLESAVMIDANIGDYGNVRFETPELSIQRAGRPGSELLNAERMPLSGAQNGPEEVEQKIVGTRIADHFSLPCQHGHEQILCGGLAGTAGNGNEASPSQRPTMAANQGGENAPQCSENPFA